jgi:hypothetical protein
MTTAVENGLATVAQTHDALAVSRKTLDRMIEQGVIEPVRPHADVRRSSPPTMPL